MLVSPSRRAPYVDRLVLLRDSHLPVSFFQLRLSIRSGRRPTGGVVAEVGVVEDAKLDGDEGGLGGVGPLAESRVCLLPALKQLPCLT